MAASPLEELLERDESAVLSDWVRRQLAGTGGAPSVLQESELRTQSRSFLQAFRAGVREAGLDGGAGIDAPAWDDARTVLAELSRDRAHRGFTPRETATFVFSLKEPLFERLRERLSGEALAEAIWSTTRAVDALGLYTAEAYQKTRDEIIVRQQHELLELSTPVVELWDGVLALPLIGTLDSARTQVVMETLLDKIVKTGAPIAIIDITGVPTVDTLVAQHLLKTVAAARLMGADCIVSGIRPQIAQTIVHLGVDLSAVVTKATLADAFSLALERSGLAIGPAGIGPAGIAAAPVAARVA
jgi:rsbT co-antagonist protein RsbR